ncbi:MAG: UbiA family prenyltransferase, partial [Petrotogales bacterium]
TEILIEVPLLGNISTSNAAVQHLLLLIIFTYFIDDAHDLAEGIYDAVGDRKSGVKTFTTSFGSKTAAKISFSMFFISGILGIVLYFTTVLTLIFLIPFLAIWIYNLYYAYNLVTADEKRMKTLGRIVGRKGFDYFLLSYNLIFIDVLIQLLISNFLK